MKRLYRSRRNRVIAGVCGGIGEYLNVDPVLVRIVAVLLLFAGGGSLIAYIVCIFVIPEEPLVNVQSSESDSIPPPPPSEIMRSSGHTGGLIAGAILVLIGMLFLMRNIPIFSEYYWWIWHMGWRYFWPLLLIALGLLIVLRSTSNKPQ